MNFDIIGQRIYQYCHPTIKSKSKKGIISCNLGKNLNAALDGILFALPLHLIKQLLVLVKIKFVRGIADGLQKLLQ